MARWKQNIRTYYPELLKSIDTDNGLRGELIELMSSSFPRRAIKRIWDMTDRAQRVAELLDHLQKGDERRFKDFCKALEKSGQEHIIKDYLKSGCQAGGDTTDAVPHDPDDMPLSRENSCKLTACWNELIDRIDGGIELLGYLESLKVFSDLQLKKLKDIQSEPDRNEWMLRYLEKGSQKSFNNFCIALKRNNQCFLINSMNESVMKHQQRSSLNENKPLVSGDASVESTAVKCTENPADETRAPLTEIATECVQVSEGTSLEPTQLLETTQRVVDLNIEQQSEAENTAGVYQVTSNADVERMRGEIARGKAYDTYSADPQKHRGHALIIANSVFSSRNLTERKGTEDDVRALKRVFEWLNFKVVVHENLSSEDIVSVCRDEGQENSENRVFILCILSHGEKGAVFGTDGNPVQVEHLEELFDGEYCNQLAGRPKLFLIQACQGGKVTEGVTCHDRTDADDDAAESTDTGNNASQSSQPKTHEKADMAVVSAAYPDYAAYRNEMTGSYFIQQFCDVMSHLAHQEHFLDIITQVNSKLDKLTMAGKHKQVCLLRTTLTKKLYLFPLP